MRKESEENIMGRKFVTGSMVKRAAAAALSAVMILAVSGCASVKPTEGDAVEIGRAHV